MIKKRSFVFGEIVIVISGVVLLGAMHSSFDPHNDLVVNEAKAVTSMYIIASAASTYRAANSGFPSDLSVLYVNQTPPYIDSVLASGIKDGYMFHLTGTKRDANGNFQGFLAQATPKTIGITGRRYFSIDTSGVIRNGLTANAALTENPLD